MRLLELDSSWWLLGNVVDDSADTWNLVDDSGGDTAEELSVKIEPIGGHVVGGLDGTEGDDLVVDTLVTHDTDGADREEGSEGLGDLAVETGGLNLLDEDVVGLAGNVDLFWGYLTEDTDGNSWSWEGVAPDEILWNAEVGTEDADLILEELTERLNELEVHVLEETTNILQTVSTTHAVTSR